MKRKPGTFAEFKAHMLAVARGKRQVEPGAPCSWVERLLSMPRVRPAASQQHGPAFIRDEILAELGLTVRQSAEIVSVDSSALSDAVNGTVASSGDMAAMHRRSVRVDVAMPLRMQAH